MRVLIPKYSKVFRELKQIPRTWWIRLLAEEKEDDERLENSSPSSSSASASAIRSILALPIVARIVSAGGRVIASLPRKTETFSPKSEEKELPTTCINRIRTFDRNFHYVRIRKTIPRRRKPIPFRAVWKSHFPRLWSCDSKFRITTASLLSNIKFWIAIIINCNK